MTTCARRIGDALSLILTTVLLTACPQRTAVWIESGSTSNHLVIDLGSKRGSLGDADIGVVRVHRCDASPTGSGAAWVVGPNGGTARFSRLVYGETPSGFISSQGPTPLVAGCYRVEISGTGQAAFYVGRDGTVTERQRE